MDRGKQFRSAALQVHARRRDTSAHRGCGAIAASDDDVREREGSRAGRGKRMKGGRGRGDGGGASGDGRVRIFDTTLRDGEQAPGCTMTSSEKLAVARQLARLRVDVIEAGFPAASDGDWAAVHEIAGEVGGEGGPAICGLARASERDLARC